VMPDGDNNFYIDSAMVEDYDGCMTKGIGMFAPIQPHEWTCVHASNYATYIVDDLIGWVDGHYRTIAAREGRAIAGLSMGGYGALELGMRFTDKFAAAASHSGVDALLYESPYPYPTGHPEQVKQLADVTKWGEGGGMMTEWIRGVFGTDRDAWVALDPITLAGKLLPGKLAIYLDCGTEDDFNLNNAAAYLHDVLTARKIDHAFFLGPGRHDFEFWSARVPFSLAFLKDHTAAAR
jgi:S-formylglutathione hydrolase FrmB